MLPYHLSTQDRLLVTTRQPAVAHRLCEVVARPRALTEAQAMQVLSQGLPTPLVRAHRAVLRTLSRQVGYLPATLEQIGSVLRQAARTHSSRRWHEALTALMQPATCLRLALPPASCSLAASIERSEAWLPASSRQALRVLVAHVPAAPATFTEAQVVGRLQGVGSCSLSDLDHLVDAGLLDARGPDRYQLHPVIAAYARLVMQEQETGVARP